MQPRWCMSVYECEYCMQIFSIKDAGKIYIFTSLWGVEGETHIVSVTILHYYDYLVKLVLSRKDWGDGAGEQDERCRKPLLPQTPPTPHTHTPSCRVCTYACVRIFWMSPLPPFTFTRPPEQVREERKNEKVLKAMCFMIGEWDEMMMACVGR